LSGMFNLWCQNDIKFGQERFVPGSVYLWTFVLTGGPQDLLTNRAKLSVVTKSAIAISKIVEVGYNVVGITARKVTERNPISICTNWGSENITADNGTYEIGLVFTVTASDRAWTDDAAFEASVYQALAADGVQGTVKLGRWDELEVGETDAERREAHAFWSKQSVLYLMANGSFRASAEWSDILGGKLAPNFGEGAVNDYRAIKPFQLAKPKPVEPDRGAPPSPDKTDEDLIPPIKLPYADSQGRQIELKPWLVVGVGAALGYVLARKWMAL
jgi:hypothetical protein